MVRLNPTTVALTYESLDSSSTISGALLAFTSSPAAPLWRASLPAETYPITIGVTHDGLGAFAFHRATKTYSAMIFNAADGQIVRDLPLPLVHTFSSGEFTDSVLILMSSTDSNGVGGWTIGGYSLQDGSALWLQALGDHPSVTYGLADGLVFFLGGTAKGDALIAANANDGAREWTAPLPGYAYVDGDADHIYVTFSGNTTQISSFASGDGATAWSHSWSGATDRSTSASEVTVYQGTVYFGVTAYDANHNPTLPSTMYALAGADGSTVWKQTISGWLRYPTETDRA